MKYLLDSNIVTDFYDRSAPDHPAICLQLADRGDEDEVFVSIITLYEFEYGLANAPEDRREMVEKKLSETLTDFETLPLSLSGAKIFGSMKKVLRDFRHLSSEGIKKHSVDLMIAATAVDEGCTLVSNDTVYKDLFDGFSELRLQSWK